MIIIKKYFEYLGIIGLCLLSFYYTEKVALFVKNKNPIMRSINEVKESLYVSSIDSTIIDDIYIIPGLSGKEINADLSFSKMQEKSIFDEDKLVYNQIKPTISIEDNKDKIIIRGNKEKRSVSLIFESKNDLAKYMYQNNYKVNVLISKEEYDFNYELINNSNNSKTYNSIESFLNKKKQNNNLCFVNNNQVPELCKDKYLIKPSLEISHSNISTEKNKVDSGEIIYIRNTLSLAELNILLNQIHYKDLKIVPISELIKESK